MRYSCHIPPATTILSSHCPYDYQSHAGCSHRVKPRSTISHIMPGSRGPIKAGDMCDVGGE